MREDFNLKDRVKKEVYMNFSNLLLEYCKKGRIKMEEKYGYLGEGDKVYLEKINFIYNECFCNKEFDSARKVADITSYVCFHGNNYIMPVLRLLLEIENQSVRNKLFKHFGEVLKKTEEFDKEKNKLLIINGWEGTTNQISRRNYTALLEFKRIVDYTITQKELDYSVVPNIMIEREIFTNESKDFIAMTIREEF